MKREMIERAWRNVNGRAVCTSICSNNFLSLCLLLVRLMMGHSENSYYYAIPNSGGMRLRPLLLLMDIVELNKKS